MTPLTVTVHTRIGWPAIGYSSRWLSVFWRCAEWRIGEGKERGRLWFGALRIGGWLWYHTNTDVTLEGGGETWTS